MFPRYSQRAAETPLIHLADTDIDVFGCRLDSDQDISVDEALDYLSRDERHRARRYHFISDSEHYVRCRGYLRKLLGAFQAKHPGAIRFSYGENGKPFLRGENISFNVSHSNGVAVCAISRRAEVGIDVEFNDPRRCVEEVMQLVFTPAERHQLQLCQGSAATALFFQLWTAKEAFMKLTGEGMSLHPRQIEIGFDRGRPQRYIRPGDGRVRLDHLSLFGSSFSCHIASAPRGAFSQAHSLQTDKAT
ncbi:4'-phosphopantetheinyl transferase superfamily protein [Microbulbifer sp. SAOS-129_SWC]|uniref:4'-phosphopantetheinyl transferase family protein n=1 Tax=Microbulbifer sp. SAOS-129_SWC TaxID=3145235 RepID=UPI003216CB91